MTKRHMTPEDRKEIDVAFKEKQAVEQALHVALCDRKPKEEINEAIRTFEQAKQNYRFLANHMPVFNKLLRQGISLRLNKLKCSGFDASAFVPVIERANRKPDSVRDEIDVRKHGRILFKNF